MFNSPNLKGDTSLPTLPFNPLGGFSESEKKSSLMKDDYKQYIRQV